MDFVKSPYSIFRHDVLKQVFASLCLGIMS